MTELLQDMLLQLAATADKDEKVRMDLWRSFAAVALNLVPWNEPFGPELFNAVSDKSVGIPFEGVMLRWQRSVWWRRRRLEVFMTRRGPNEVYANQLHAPGTFIRRGEIKDVNNFDLVFLRLSAKEFGGLPGFYELVDIAGGSEERGTSLSLIFLVNEEDPTTKGLGRWYPVDALPPNTVESHRRDIIRRAADEFRFRARWWVRLGNWFLSMVGAKLARQEEFK